MFDISWGELLVVGAVALLIIGPKDLPKALRTLGNATSKLKRMAFEFQGQFNEAMREAELDEIRKSVSSVGDAAGNLNQGFNPIQTIRDEIKGAIDAKPETATSAVAPEQPSGPPPALDIADVPPVPDARAIMADAAAGAPLDIAPAPEPAHETPKAGEAERVQEAAEPKAGPA